MIAAIAAGWITVLAFFPAVRGGLLEWDDRANLVTNTAYQGLSLSSLRFAFTTFHLGPYQPLSWLSYTLDHAIWNGDPRGFYVTNIVLAAVTAALLTLLTARLLRRAVPALAAKPQLLATLSAAGALLWAVHPQRVESVAWATERRDVLSALFLVASALAWMSHASEDGDGTPDGSAPPRPWFRRRAYWLALALFAASLLSKATAMGFVVVLVLLDRYPLGRSFRKNLAEKVPFALAGLAIAAVAWIGQRDSGAALTVDDMPLLARVVVAGFATSHYLVATLWPEGLRAHYQRPHADEFLRPDLLVGLLATVAMANIVLLLRNRFPALVTAFGAYVVLLAPVSGLTLTGAQLVADRYSHQPTMAISILGVGVLGAWLVKERTGARPIAPAVPLVALGGVVLLLGAFTFRLSSTWRTPEALWGRVLEFEPENWVAHEQLAKSAYDRGDKESAALHLDASLKSQPDRLVATVFLALCLYDLGRYDEALALVNRVLQHVPDEAGAWRMKGKILRAQRDIDGAIAAYERSLAAKPDNVLVVQEMAEMLSRSRSAEAAEPYARRLCELSPNDANALAFLGTLRAQRGARDEAATLFERAIVMDGAAFLPHLCLADLYAAGGDMPRAERELEVVLRLQPQNAEALEKMAAVAAQRGAMAEAIDYMLRAVTAAPDRPDLRLRLAGALFREGRHDEAIAAARAAAAVATAAGDSATARRADEFVEHVKNAPQKPR